MAKKKEQEKNNLKFQSPKGMRDILPEEQPWWDKIRKVCSYNAEFYNFLRIDTPILENAEIFERAIGESTDIVEKQMFILKTKGGDRLALRPEMTAGVVRAYLQHSLSKLGKPVKLYYFGPVFRHEQPQSGRYRQFHQAGFEILGSDDPIHDAQMILITSKFIEDLKIKNLNIQVNSIGCNNCRGGYKKKLVSYYEKYKNKICKDCKRRITLNPLRLLDCKNKECQSIKIQAPTIIDYLCGHCREHFKRVLEYLDDLKLPYILNPYLVRGLDYYNKTVFEIFSGDSQMAIASGGRYDFLGEILGGKKGEVLGIGAAIGAERLIETMKLQGIICSPRLKLKVFLIQIGEEAKKRALLLIEEFRKADIKLYEALGKESLKSQLRSANKKEVDISLILGQKEVFEENIIIRDMKTGTQEIASLAKVVDEIKRRTH